MNNLTFRQKNIALAIGTILLALVAYQFSFSKTLDAQRQFKKVQQRLQTANSAEQSIQHYQQQLSNWGTSSNAKPYHPDVFFSAISQFCDKNDLQVLDFPQAEKVDDGNYEVITNIIEVSGSHANIVRLAYMIEQAKGIGRISSLTFNTQQNNRTKETILTGQFYIQNILTKKATTLQQ